MSHLIEIVGAHAPGMLQKLVMQEEGGTTAAIKKGIELVSAMLGQANTFTREAVPISKLIVGLNCGGSDGYSGITANPALGGASDKTGRARCDDHSLRDAGNLRRRAPADATCSEPRDCPEAD